MADLLDFASHEAGHAVAMWVVGWESDLMWIEMRRDGNVATEAGMMPAKRPIENLAALRSLLVVLWAGTAVTGQNDFDRDLMKMVLAIKRFYPGLEFKVLNFPVRFTDALADELLQKSRIVTAGIISHAQVRKAIDAVAELLLDAIPNADGVAKVDGKDIVATCAKECGDELRESIEWRDWLLGN